MEHFRSATGEETAMRSAHKDADVAAIAARLNEPVDSDKLKTRPIGGGMQAAYIPGDRIISTANEVFGFQRWSDEVRKLEVDYCVQDSDKRWNVGIYAIMRVYFLVDGKPACWREDVGYDSASRVPQLEAAMEKARKGAITDARKRCFRLFGETFGTHVSSADFQLAARNQQFAAKSSMTTAAMSTVQTESLRSAPRLPTAALNVPAIATHATVASVSSSVITEVTAQRVASASVQRFNASELLAPDRPAVGVTAIDTTTNALNGANHHVANVAPDNLMFSLPDDLLGDIDVPAAAAPTRVSVEETARIASIATSHHTDAANVQHSTALSVQPGGTGNATGNEDCASSGRKRSRQEVEAMKEAALQRQRQRERVMSANNANLAPQAPGLAHHQGGTSISTAPGAVHGTAAEFPGASPSHTNPPITHQNGAPSNHAHAMPHAPMAYRPSIYDSVDSSAASSPSIRPPGR